MLSFLDSAVRFALGLITGDWKSSLANVISHFGNTLKSEYRYWHAVMSRAIAGWRVLTRGILRFLAGFQRFAFAVFAYLAYLVRHVIPALARAILVLGRKLESDIANTIGTLRHDIASAIAVERKFAESVLKWVNVHVLRYLYRLVKPAVDWVAHEGASVWHYFTHPDKFAEFLFWHLVAMLERQAWNAGKRLGRFFLALIVHNVVKFATLVESIVDAVL